MICLDGFCFEDGSCLDGFCFEDGSHTFQKEREEMCSNKTKADSILFFKKKFNYYFNFLLICITYIYI